MVQLLHGSGAFTKMSKLYACVITNAQKEKLIEIAEGFAYRIEWLGDGVLFDVSGLEGLIGDAHETARSIEQTLSSGGLSANIAIAENAEAAIITARNKQGISIVSEKELNRLSLPSLDIDPDTLWVFDTLGFRDVRDLKAVPESELISRYGPQFRNTIDLALGNGKHILTPNLKENKVSWSYELDHPVSDFEQLIFILRHGLEKVFTKTSSYGLKTEQIDIHLKLDKTDDKNYEIKVSFPTLDIKFWLKIVDLRISIDPPEAGILSISVTSHFIKPRTVQKGLYSAVKPEPESLLLTVNKIKKLLGEENVGVSVVLNQRLEKAFALDHTLLPIGKETTSNKKTVPSLILNYFNPPLPADVIVNQKRLMYVRTARFEGEVKEYGGVWKASSSWWKPRKWQTEEWDVEIAGGGIYRLQRHGKEWFVVGEYD